MLVQECDRNGTPTHRSPAPVFGARAGWRTHGPTAGAMSACVAPAEIARSGTLRVSAVIPTKNEERNLTECLAALGFAAERIVLDSHSDDRTREIAEAAGARIVRRTFDVFSTHKNWALDTIDFAHDWILLVDGDERVTPALAAEIRDIVEAHDPGDSEAPVAWYIPRRNFFEGRWIRHGGMYPDYQMRLLRRGRARYEDRIVHEHMVAEGPVGYCRNHFIHYDSKGIERYFERHNHYTSLEAVEVHRLLEKGVVGALVGHLFGSAPQRRRALKNFAYRYMPARWLTLFLYMYVVRLGFLDGRIGFRYALIRAFHEYQIDLKLIELRNPDSPIREKYRVWLER